ncbi:hypothetical protein [Streptomyces geranii]|uniref:hypothetical protein n=1 Tax=Streptomyces geranii TaxID=2058923 RepID=UPI0038CD9A99
MPPGSRRHRLAEAREVLCHGAVACELGARHLAGSLGRIGRRARFAGDTGFAPADVPRALLPGEQGSRRG